MHEFVIRLMKQLTIYFGAIVGYKILKHLYKNNHVIQACTDSVEKLKSLTLSWWKSLSYRSQSIDLQSKSMDWFLCHRDFRHGRVKLSLEITVTSIFRLPEILAKLRTLQVKGKTILNN